MKEKAPHGRRLNHNLGRYDFSKNTQPLKGNNDLGEDLQADEQIIEKLAALNPLEYDRVRKEIADEVKIKLQEALTESETGLKLANVELKKTNVPEPVQPSFNEVNQAQQERERMINEANGEYNKEVPRSRGVADQKIQAAEGYALKRVNEALGDVASFNSMLAEYKKAPEITRTRLYLESMKEVVPQMGKKIILDEDASQILPLLQLNDSNKGGLVR